MAKAARESHNLDFLRSFAVFLVLLDHLLVYHGEPTDSFLTLHRVGRGGVLLFFVHTCLVLMLSMQRQEGKMGRKRLFSIFMVRRGFRVYPLSILVVMIIFLLHLPSASTRAFGFGWMPITLKDLVANLLLVQNMTFSPSLTLPLWSLPYEMQMYVFLPAIYLLTQRYNGRKALAALWIGALVLAFLPWPTERLSLLFRFWPCFIPGVIAYQLTKRYVPTWSPWLFPPFLVAIALLNVAGNHYDKPLVYEPLFGGILCLMVGLALPHFREITHPVVVRVTHLIARYSYGIYVAHLTLIWLAFVKLGFLPAPLRWAALLAFWVLVPMALYHGVEAPMIRLGNRIAERMAPRKVAPFPEPERAVDTTSVP